MSVGLGGRLGLECKGLVWSVLDLRESRREGALWARLLELNECKFDSVVQRDVYRES